MRIVTTILLALTMALAGACTSDEDPDSYCDKDVKCMSVERSVCDLNGACAASEGITNVCIPLAEICWDAGAAGQDADLASDAGALDAGP